MSSLADRPEKRSASPFLPCFMTREPGIFTCLVRVEVLSPRDITLEIISRNNPSLVFETTDVRPNSFFGRWKEGAEKPCEAWEACAPRARRSAFGYAG